WLWAFEAATAGGNDGPGRLRLVLALLPPDGRGVCCSAPEEGHLETDTVAPRSRAAPSYLCRAGADAEPARPAGHRGGLGTTRGLRRRRPARIPDAARPARPRDRRSCVGRLRARQLRRPRDPGRGGAPAAAQPRDPRMARRGDAPGGPRRDAVRR